MSRDMDEPADQSSEPLPSDSTVNRAKTSTADGNEEENFSPPLFFKGQEVEKMKVAELRSALDSLGVDVPPRSRKSVLIDELRRTILQNGENTLNRLKQHTPARGQIVRSLRSMDRKLRSQDRDVRRASNDSMVSNSSSKLRRRNRRSESSAVSRTVVLTSSSMSSWKSPHGIRHKMKPEFEDESRDDRESEMVSSDDDGADLEGANEDDANAEASRSYGRSGRPTVKHSQHLSSSRSSSISRDEDVHFQYLHHPHQPEDEFSKGSAIHGLRSMDRKLRSQDHNHEEHPHPPSDAGAPSFHRSKRPHVLSDHSQDSSISSVEVISLKEIGSTEQQGKANKRSQEELNDLGQDDGTNEYDFVDDGNERGYDEDETASLHADRHELEDHLKEAETRNSENLNCQRDSGLLVEDVDSSNESMENEVTTEKERFVDEGHSDDSETEDRKQMPMSIFDVEECDGDDDSVASDEFFEANEYCSDGDKEEEGDEKECRGNGEHPVVIDDEEQGSESGENQDLETNMESGVEPEAKRMWVESVTVEVFSDDEVGVVIEEVVTPELLQGDSSEEVAMSEQPQADSSSLNASVLPPSEQHSKQINGVRDELMMPVNFLGLAKLAMERFGERFAIILNGNGSAEEVAELALLISGGKDRPPAAHSKGPSVFDEEEAEASQNKKVSFHTSTLPTDRVATFAVGTPHPRGRSAENSVTSSQFTFPNSESDLNRSLEDSASENRRISFDGLAWRSRESFLPTPDDRSFILTGSRTPYSRDESLLDHSVDRPAMYRADIPGSTPYHRDFHRDSFSSASVAPENKTPDTEDSLFFRSQGVRFSTEPPLVYPNAGMGDPWADILGKENRKRGWSDDENGLDVSLENAKKRQTVGLSRTSFSSSFGSGDYSSKPQTPFQPRSAADFQVGANRSLPRRSGAPPIASIETSIAAASQDSSSKGSSRSRPSEILIQPSKQSAALTRRQTLSFLQRRKAAAAATGITSADNSSFPMVISHTPLPSRDRPSVDIGANRGSAIVAKRILDTLSDLTSPMEELKKKPVGVPTSTLLRLPDPRTVVTEPTTSSSSTSNQPSGLGQKLSKPKVGFVEESKAESNPAKPRKETIDVDPTEKEFIFESPDKLLELEEAGAVRKLSDINAGEENDTIRFVFSPPGKRPRKSLQTPAKAKEIVSAQSEKESSADKPSGGVNPPALLVVNEPVKTVPAPGLAAKAAVSTTVLAADSIWAKAASSELVKCPTCMVPNAKSAVKCVSCESLMAPSAAASASASNSKPAWAAPPLATTGTIGSSGFTFGGSGSAATSFGATESAKAADAAKPTPSASFSFGTSTLVQPSIAPSVTSSTSSPSAQTAFAPKATASKPMEAASGLLAQSPPFSFSAGDSSKKTAPAFSFSAGDSSKKAVPTFSFSAGAPNASSETSAIGFSSAGTEKIRTDASSAGIGFRFSTEAAPANTAVKIPEASPAFSFGSAPIGKSKRSADGDEKEEAQATQKEDAEDGTRKAKRSAPEIASFPSASFGSSSTPAFSFGAPRAMPSLPVPSSTVISSTNQSASSVFGSTTSSIGTASSTAPSSFDIPAKVSSDAAAPGSKPAFSFGAAPITGSSSSTSGAFQLPGSGSLAPQKEAEKPPSLPLSAASKPFVFGASIAASTSTPAATAISAPTSTGTKLEGDPASATVPASTIPKPFQFGSVPAAPVNSTSGSSFAFGSSSPSTAFAPFGGGATTSFGAPSSNTATASKPFSAAGEWAFSFGASTNKSTEPTTAAAIVPDSPGATMDTGYNSGDASNISSVSIPPAVPSSVPMFGQPASSSSAFGAQFGSSAATSGSGIGIAFNRSGSSSNIFGAPSQAPQPTLPSVSSAPSFGSLSQATPFTFGASNMSSFGAPSTQPVFGAPSSQSSQPTPAFMFGGPGMGAQPAVAGASGGFNLGASDKPEGSKRRILRAKRPGQVG